MTTYRDHKPIPIEEFNGLWDRGDQEDVPLNHFRDCENLDTSRFGSGFMSRDGLGLHQNVASPLQNIIRMHNYVMQTGYTLLVLTRDTTVSTTYKLWHVVNGTTVHGPIHTLTGMSTTPDFKCVSYAGRAYISFFATFGSGDTAVEKGLQNEFVYVYAGDGTAIRKAAGTPPDESMDLTISNSAPTGYTDPGLHTFGVCFETSSGFITAPGRLSSWTTVADHGVDFADIPISADPNVIARRLVASAVIPDFNGDTSGYTFYFIPDGRIPNNSATTLSNISFYDADLLEDASHLIDNYTEIPAGAALGLYQNRLCVGATYTDISLALVSTAGEPEAISQIDGLLIIPLDGTAITTFAELRDVLYVFKRAKTNAYSDNGDAPSTWPFTQIDQAFGCPVHGIATVIDSGEISLDFLIVASYAGVMIFNGKYAIPELSWKIQDLWFNQDREFFCRMQLCNDVISKSLFLNLPDYRMLKADYADGLDPQKIKWWPWRFTVNVNTIALTNIDDLIIGAGS